MNLTVITPATYRLRALLCSLTLLAAPAFAQECFTWTNVTPPAPAQPTPRYLHMAAYDTARNVLVLFGGADATYQMLGDTWEFDGVTWTLRATGGPAPRVNGGMVYDPARGVCVLFGGDQYPLGFRGDTWEWNGTSWTETTPAITPSPRVGFGCTYDSVRGCMQIWGGIGSPGDNELWEYSAGVWTFRGAGGPPGRWSTEMTYDATRQRTVLFGGVTPGGVRLGDTWEYNAAANAWSQVFPTTSPAPREGNTMTWDPALGVCLFGGITDTSFVADFWTFDGTTWTPRPSNPPYARWYSVLVRNPSANELWLAAGSSWAGVIYNDVWAFGGGEWRPRSNASPGGRDQHKLAYDSGRDRIVLFGGRSTFNQSDTWEWDGDEWIFRSSVGPPARGAHCMAYDSVRGFTYVFGGINEYSTGYLGDTWRWDGQNWTQLFPATSPSARSNLGGMSFDSARQVCVMFGGFDGVNRFGDTWEWNGSDWTLRSATGPTPRTGHGVAYDSNRGVTVLFGGRDAAGRQGDTWEWDGAAWTLRATSGPSPRSPYMLAYDESKRLTVLFGGIDAAGANLGDTWAWNGNSWRQVASTGPSARGNHFAVYDALRENVLLYGGFPAPGDVWRGSPQVDAADLDVDGAVGLSDLAALLSNFGTASGATPDQGDLNGDGDVDLSDLAGLLGSFGTACP